MAGKLEPVFAWFLRQWYRLTYAAKRAANEIAGVFVKVVQIGENLINGDDWDKDLDILNKAIEEQNQELADAFKKNMEAAPDQAKRAARATADALKGVRDLLGGAWDQLKAPGGLHMKVSVELETPASTWDRIQKAFAEGKNDINPQLDGHLGAIRGQLNQQLNEMKKKIGMGQ